MAISSKLKIVLTPAVNADISSAPDATGASSPSFLSFLPKTEVEVRRAVCGRIGEVKADVDATRAVRRAILFIMLALLL